MRAIVMFNGSLYEGDVVKETAKRLLVRFDTGTGFGSRDGWVSKVVRPVGNLVGRRATLRPGDVTIPANSGFTLEG